MVTNLKVIMRKTLWVFSSVGLERYLDRVEVMGSNPLTPTKASNGGFCGN
jgi:hypothetical protein